MPMQNHHSAVCYTVWLQTFVLIQFSFVCQADFFPRTVIITDNMTTEFNAEYFENITFVVNNAGTPDASISGYMRPIKKLPPDAILKLNLFRYLAGEYQAMGNPIISSYCDYIEKNKIFYAGIMEAGNFPKKCASPMQDYYMEDYRCPVKDLPPLLPGGKWKVTFSLTTQDVSIFMLGWYGTLKSAN